MISVLVRSHNDIEYIRKTIEMLLSQELDGEAMEIISCDDHSTDGTREYLESVGEVRKIEPPEGRYVPGKTLNYMVSQAKGEYIIFNNGDAIPQSKDYLLKLTAPLKDAEPDCVFAKQVARADALKVVERDYLSVFGEGKLASQNKGFFSLVSSGFRKDELIKHPFDETFQYSEDSAWVNKRPVKIVYVIGAVVEHSHNYSLKAVKKRFFNEGIADTQMGKKPINLVHTCRRIVVDILRDWYYIIKCGAGREFLYSPLYRLVQKISYYRGANR